MTIFYKEDGSQIEGELCSDCKEIIPGTKMLTKLSNIVIVNEDNEITGYMVGGDWIGQYSCLNCIHNDLMNKCLKK